MAVRLQPGQRNLLSAGHWGEILIHFDTNSKQGRQAKQIMVEDGQERNPTQSVLKIQADVIVAGRIVPTPVEAPPM